MSYSNPLDVWLAASGLIISLLALAISIEYRRRRAAENASRRHLAAMTHMNRLAIMGQLSASLAHELHQPLGAILRNSEAATMMLASENVPIAELQEIVEDIRNDDKRAADIIRRMRSLVRKGELRHDAVDLNEVVRETVPIVRRATVLRAVRIDMNLSGTPPVVAGDAVHLQQVLLNVMLNAVDAVAPVTDAARQLLVTTSVEGGLVTLAVRDNGPGFRQECIEQIFEPFETTKPEGLGLGLAIARSIVEAHRGRIVAENNIDTGATVRLALPAAVNRTC
jgi:C4-dicarboxylate-specific signal transduction histidine kinase